MTDRKLLAENGRLRRRALLAEARLKQAVEVMRPFAERASKLDGIWKEHETDWSPAYGSTAITIGHLRAASQFIEEQTDADK